MKISCIMPTANRRRFVAVAIRYFLAQDHDDKELIVLDDGDDRVGDLVSDHPQLRYRRLDARLPLGAKRNLACDMARGEIIAHWDDDDWHAPARLRRQVEALLASGADVCGLDRVLFLDAAGQRAFEYVYPKDGTPWVCGGTLCFYKALWRRNPFPQINAGEDTRFIFSARGARVHALPDNTIFVGLIHGANTSPKQTRDPRWQPRPLEVIRAAMGGDWATYAGAGDGMSGSRPRMQGGPVAGGASESDAHGRIEAGAVMSKVAIGIHVVDDVARLLATLRSLEANTSPAAEIVLLGDGADAIPPLASEPAARYLKLCTDKRRGAPACFNRLIQRGEADLFVFVENGALVGPGWLSLIEAALRAHPSNGLAGPSTNRAWNMQQEFPGRTGDNRGIAATAARAGAEHGRSYRTMAPLYCLADFCYAVTREVVQAIGAADEAYAEGPCWEMDYSIRAVRSGFRPIWVQGAYVHRLPPTPRREREEARRIEASKRLYQDRFCARRLRGDTQAYETHCRGEDCEHFAPADLIRRRLPFSDAGAPQPSLVAVPAASAIGGTVPRVSCIMPTANRRSFLQLALACFDAQDYAKKELIVVDDGNQPVADLLEGRENVRHLRLPGRCSIGRKRNIGCEAATGDVIMHWDDDDWYGPQRISQQIVPIASGNADLSGLETRWIFDLASGEFWAVSPTLHRRMFAGDVHGGTLAFARTVWNRGVRYPDADLAEDADFLRNAMRLGMRLVRISNPNLFVYSRHHRNAWRFPLGQFIDPTSWLKTPAPSALSVDIIASYQEAAREFLSQRSHHVL